MAGCGMARRDKDGQGKACYGLRRGSRKAPFSCIVAEQRNPSLFGLDAMIELPASPRTARSCTDKEGMRLLDWRNHHGISRTTAYALLRATGIKPANTRITGINKPVSFLTKDQLVAMDMVVEKYKSGRSVNDLSVGGQSENAKVSQKLRVDILTRDNYTCQMCGIGRKDGAILEIDHIHPVSRGGTNDPKNLQVLCRECNGGKSNRIVLGQV